MKHLQKYRIYYIKNYERIKQNLMSFNLEGPSNLARLKVVSSL